jgi:hypothetical protein
MNRLLARLGLIALPLLPATVTADVVKLKSGGELRGVLVEAADGEASEVVTIETLSGGTVAVSRADVEFVTRRPRLIEEYEVKAKAAADTVDAQWALAEWCRENDLEEQRATHLQRIVELEPDHAEARSALDQTNYEGEWLTREEIMEKRGLVPHRGRWITPQELELIEKSQAEREREQAWFTTVRKLKAWLRGNNDQLRQKGIAGLKALNDPDAVPALEKFFRDDPEADVRKLYVSVIAGMPGPKPVRPLVTQSLHDVDYQVRYASLAGIGEERREDALPYFLQGLRHASNDVVRRAGKGLEEVGDERAVPDLIKSLITAHQHGIQVPETLPTYSFTTGGSYGPGGLPIPSDVATALRTGQLPYGVQIVEPQKVVRWKTVMISVNHENPEVLAALRKITGESFGFDERTWRLWLAAKKNGAG